MKIQTLSTIEDSAGVCSLFFTPPLRTNKELTLKMASAQVVEMSVTNNSPSQDSSHPDDLFQSRYVTPGFKPFS